MDKDELKKVHSMLSIVRQYGFHPNKKGFINCPFHTEKSSSMKIYEDSYHCFGCGATGDIFSFVMAMDNISFKEAFLSLGGTYEQDAFAAKLARYRSLAKQEARIKSEIKTKRKIELNNCLITIYRKWYLRSEPFSDAWTDCYNKLQYQLYVHEILNRKEV